jgi:hypothetical protein
MRKNQIPILKCVSMKKNVELTETKLQGPNRNDGNSLTFSITASNPQKLSSTTKEGKAIPVTGRRSYLIL